MRTTRLLISIVAVGAAASLGPGGCSCNSSSSSSPPAQGDDAGDDSGEQTTPDSGGGTPDASTPVEGGTTPTEAGTTPTEAGTSNDGGAEGDGGDTISVTYDTCPDTNATNTTAADAYGLTLGSTGSVGVQAGVIQGSDEYFKWTSPKHDPANVYLNYTVTGSSTAQLSLEDDSITGAYQDNDDTTRTTSSQTLTTFFEQSANGVYTADIASNSATCTTFDLYVDALYCTDQYEDNDTAATASTIPFATTTYTAPTTWATATANITATIDGFDDDYYTFTAPLHDPMSVSVTYTVPTGETTQLSLEVDDSEGGYQDNDDTARTSASETLNTYWEPAAAGGAFVAHVSSNTQGVCTRGYTVSFNGLWCTDNYEDNDTFATAVTLPDTTSTPTNAQITTFDDDYYVIPSPAVNGSCSVTYTVPAGSQQQLAIELDTVTNGYIDNDDTARSGNTETLTVSWTSEDSPYSLYVHANKDDCTPYTITCTSD